MDPYRLALLVFCTAAALALPAQELPLRDTHTYRVTRLAVGPNDPKTPDGKPHRRFSVRCMAPGDYAVFRIDGEMVNHDYREQPQAFELRPRLEHGFIERQGNEWTARFTANDELIFDLVLIAPHSAGDVGFQVDIYTRGWVPPFMERFRHAGTLAAHAAPVDIPVQVDSRRGQVEIDLWTDNKNHILEWGVGLGSEFTSRPWKSSSIVELVPMKYRGGYTEVGQYTVRVNSLGRQTRYELEISAPADMLVDEYFEPVPAATITPPLKPLHPR